MEWYLSYLQKYRPELFGLKKSDSISFLTADQKGAAPTLSVDAAEEWLKKETNALVIDLRGSLAFRGGHITRSINIAGEALEEMTEWGVPFARAKASLCLSRGRPIAQFRGALFGSRS